MPISHDGGRPRHIQAINEIEGLHARDGMRHHPSNPGREFMTTKLMFNFEKITIRYLHNGVIFNQCIEFFQEFVPIKTSSINKTLVKVDDMNYRKALVGRWRDCPCDPLNVHDP